MPAPLRACLCLSIAAFGSGVRVSVNDLDKLKEAKIDCVSIEEGRAKKDVCDVTKYYDGVRMLDVQALHERVKNGHEMLPYGKNAPDDPEYKCANVWNGLDFLDENEADSTMVDLLYSKHPAKKDAKTESYWNREHVWPKAYGASCKIKRKDWSNTRKGLKCKKKKKYDQKNYAFTDLHHLFPSHSGVNGDRSSQYFDSCDDNACEYDHHTEDGYTAEDQDAGESIDDKTFWQPPRKSRGVVARALFYMALRYNGEEKNTYDLTLTDYPSFCNDALGKLSVLKRWHKDYPPTKAEIERNEKACYLQGNRNPFVDEPSLVDELFQEKNPSLVSGDHGPCTKEQNGRMVEATPGSTWAKMCDENAGYCGSCAGPGKEEKKCEE